jgi:glyoxylase-like metal-dependent hydrolase (beta-lactamase superfamily II)
MDSRCRSGYDTVMGYARPHDRAMIFNKTGQVVADFYVLGHTWMPSYLLDGERPVIFEAALACLGRIYEKSIRTILGKRTPEILFLTHVHYDHCSATAYLTKSFPGLRVAASSLAARIIARPNARKLMRALNHKAASLITGVDRAKLLPDAFAPFEVTNIVSDGDVIHLGDNLSVVVFATPGHTRDLVSYYIPERKILIATEAVGCADITGHIVTEFIVDYESYVAGLRRLAALEVNVLCQGHHFVYVGASVQDFLSRSIESAEGFRARVEELLVAEGGVVERVVAQLKAEEYDSKPLPKQPEQAYLLNLDAQVRHLAEKLRDRS